MRFDVLGVYEWLEARLVELLLFVPLGRDVVGVVADSGAEVDAGAEGKLL